MMENIEGFGDNSFFAGCLVCHLNSPLWQLEVDFAQMGQCGPHPHISSSLPWDGFFTNTQGMAATLGGIFSSSAFSVLTAGVSFGGIGQDALALNKFMEAGLVLCYGWSSLFCGAVAVTAALGCCSS